MFIRFDSEEKDLKDNRDDKDDKDECKIEEMLFER